MIINYRKCIFNRVSKTKLSKKETKQLNKLFQWEYVEVLG